MRLTCVQIVAGFVLLAGGSYAEVQTWTSASGRSVEGEFVRLSGESLTIKCTNGKTVICQLSGLNPESRVLAKRLADETKAVSQNTVPAAFSEDKPKAAAGMSALKASAAGVPTEEEIKAFLTEYKEDPNSDESTELFASFSVPKMKPEELRGFARKKKVPYRLTLELCKMKTEDGKQKRYRMDGQGYIVILNEAGDVVDRKREALGKLCPS